MNRTATAYHEAGHAVVALSQDVPIKTVTIKAGDGYHGLAVTPVLTRRDIRNISASIETPHQRLRMEKLAMILLAGPIAQRRYAPRSWRRWHGEADYRVYGDIMFKLGGGGKSLDLYSQLLICWAETLVNHRWWQIEKVAEALLDRETLGQQEIREVLYPDLGGLDK